MTTETFNPGSTVEKTETPKRKMSPFARGAIAVSLASTAATGLAACAPGETKAEPEPTIDLYSVGDVMLDNDTIEARTNVFDLCLKSESGKAVAKDWEEYGYDEMTGKSWDEAFIYVADLKYSDDDKAIVNDGTFTYPTIEAVAGDDCLDAVYLASLPVTDIRYQATAREKLDEFHTVYGSDEVLAFERIYELNKLSAES